MSSNLRRTLLLVLLLVPLTVSSFPRHIYAAEFYQAPGDPLGSFEGPGPPAPLNWTGDGQRISNPSFETGSTSPWIQLQSNAAVGSTVQVVSPGEGDSFGSRLTVKSENVTSDSYFSLAADLTLDQVGFGASLRLRASMYIEQLSGNSDSDRVEVTVTLSTSVGQLRTIHYYYGLGSPTNGPRDAYIRVSGPLGQWLTIDKNVAADALSSFSTDYVTLDAVREVRINVISRTAGLDTKIKYVRTDIDFTWNPGESVVYDTNNNRHYNTAEPVIAGATPTDGRDLQDDPKVRFVDADSDTVWDAGESVVYDTNNNYVYDSGEPVIGTAPAPSPGTSFFRTSSSMFDKVELYSATGNFQWVRNTGFEGSLAGWGTYGVPPRFQATSTRSLSGAWSARGSVTGDMADMSQGLDGAPRIESWSTFKASAHITDMTGTTSLDYVDVWLGLVDSTLDQNLAFIHYIFKTGDGLLPANTPNTLYLTATGFGTLNSWLSVSSNLQQETSYFSTTQYTLPFHVLSVVVEVSSQGSSLTTAYFDEFSLYGPYHPGPFTQGSASSYRYAIDGRNSTYVYTASSIPHGAFYIQVPPGQSVLNITGPGGVLQPGDYVTSPLTGRIDVPDSTGFKHPPVGDWRIVTSSVNAVSTVYTEDPITRLQIASTDPGSSVNLVSRSKDPFGNPLAAANVTLAFWTSTGTAAGTPYSGTTDSQGWFNVSSVTLSNAGVLKLQATTSSLGYIGVRTFQFSALYTITVSVSLSTSQITAGSQVTISGAVSPPKQGVTINILYRPAGSSNWITLTSVQTNSAGSYSYSWTPPEGLYQIMVSTEDPQSLPAQSTRTQVSVSPGGFPDTTLLLVLGIGVAAILLLVFFLFMKRKERPRMGPPKTP